LRLKATLLDKEFLVGSCSLLELGLYCFKLYWILGFVLRGLQWFLCLYVSWHFSLETFRILSLFSRFGILIMMSWGYFFWSCLFEVWNASCTWVSILLHRFGKFSAKISLNRFSMPLVFSSFFHPVNF
jgi:hypothetical protein